MTALSETEQATLDRIEAAEPAEESLRERVARALHHDWHSEENWGAIPDSVRGYYRRLADAAIATMRGQQ